MRVFDRDNSYSLGPTILWQYEKAERLQKVIYHYSYTQCLAFRIHVAMSNTTFVMQLAGAKNDSATVYWTDDETSSVEFAVGDTLYEVSHEFAEPGDYIIRVDGDLHTFRFGSASLSYSDKDISRSAVTEFFSLVESLTSLNSSLAMCENMTMFPLDALPDGIADLTNAFYGASLLAANVPAWPSSCTKFARCFANCSSLLGCDLGYHDLDGLMPEGATETESCFTGATPSVASAFFGLWGGTRMYNDIDAKTFWNRELARMGDSTNFVICLSSAKSLSFSCLVDPDDSSSGVTIDWGDGTSTTVTSTTSHVETHAYAGIGSYLVSVKEGLHAFSVGTTGAESGTPSKLAVRYFYSWDSGIADASGTFQNCTNLLMDTIPEWGADITVAERTYMNCSKITAARIPAWNESMTNIAHCYDGCSNLGLNPRFLNYTDPVGIFTTAINYLIVSNGLESSLAKLAESAPLYEIASKFNAVKNKLQEINSALSVIPSVEQTDTVYEFVDIYNAVYKILSGNES